MGIEVIALTFIVILVIIVVSLMLYNYSIHKKVETYSNLNQRITSLNVLQEFMNTLGENLTINEKLENINDILINKYSIKYSTIVIFNGAEYEIKASNVDRKHWETLKSLQKDPVFGDSIKNATPKYITVDNENEKLPYQKMEFGRAKCAIFFPLYVDNIYIGYWIIEGSKPHEFDKTDTTILEVVRNNIVTIFKTVENQATIENTVRDDLFSGLKSAEYLYGEGKKTIDKYTMSGICMFKIVNLNTINENISRKTGNNIVTIVSNYVKENLASEYVFVRYMGPKFTIVFSGVEGNGITNFMKDMKQRIEALQINYAEDYYKNIPRDDLRRQSKNVVSPKIRVAIATYYKGTALDGALKKMEEYIDSSDDATINNL